MGPIIGASQPWTNSACPEIAAVWRFDVRVDQTPPYLSIREPEDGALVRTTPIAIEGETEKGSSVKLNGAALDVDADGRFAAEIDVPPGKGELLLEATDAAGNVTQRRRAFQYVPDEQTVLRFDDGDPAAGARATSSPTAT